MSCGNSPGGTPATGGGASATGGGTSATGGGTSATGGGTSATGGGTSATGGGSSATGGGTSATGGGTATGGGSSDGGFCAPRPFLEDDHTPDHTTRPVGFGVIGPLAVETDSTLDNPKWPGHPVTLYRPTGSTPYPVIFYSHPFGGDNPQHAEELFKRLASNGYNVVFVPYPSNGRLLQYETLWSGFTTAATHFAAKFDLTRVGFVGHSFGGGASPEMARRAFGDPLNNGLGSAWGASGRMMFIMAPWFSYPGIATPSTVSNDYHQLPDDVKTVIEVYADDDINDHQIAVNDIWNKLPPTLTEKGWILVKSDTCGSYNLNAAHTTPATYNDAGQGGPGTGNNNHDEWAVARRIHALADYALKAGGEPAKALAFPKTAEALSLGTWDSTCGNRPVVPLEASTTTPLFSTCSGQGKQNYTFDFSATTHCQWSVTGPTGTPPCR